MGQEEDSGKWDWVQSSGTGLPDSGLGKLHCEVSAFLCQGLHEFYISIQLVELFFFNLNSIWGVTTPIKAMVLKQEEL